MQSQGGLSSAIGFQARLKQLFKNQWSKLTERQKTYTKKIWGVITYKWRWQLAMNIPYLAIFLLDRTVPAVHQFDITLLSMVTSKISLPSFLTAWIGI